MTSRHFSTILLFGAAVVLSLSTISCGTRVCGQGETKPCTCRTGGPGQAACNMYGTRWDACECLPKICTANDTRACTCTNGGQGTQVCDKYESSWGTCGNCSLCTPNDTKACTCANTFPGTQVCSPAGDSWGTCENCKVCTANDTRACTCNGGYPGTEVCNGTGTSWGPCGSCQICTPNDTLACTCASGATGTKACNAAGSSWGICECASDLNVVLGWEDPQTASAFDSCINSGVTSMYVNIYDMTAGQLVYETVTNESCAELLPNITGAGQYQVTVIGYDGVGGECWIAADVVITVQYGGTTNVKIDVPYICP